MAAVTSNVENSTDMPKAAAQELTFTRVFHAPRSLVFKAWIEPERLAQWWGPRNFTNPRCEWDFRPGGRIHVDMQGPDGTVYPMVGECREIVPPFLDDGCIDHVLDHARFRARFGDRVALLHSVNVAGHETLLLGPLAVDPAQRGRGIGIALMQAGVDAAHQGPWSAIILVGDEPYYTRVGFARLMRDPDDQRDH